MVRVLTGDLVFASQKLGTLVKCIREPSMVFWGQWTLSRSFQVPLIGCTYGIRSWTVLYGTPPPNDRGVLLHGIRNQAVKYAPKGQPEERVEPFFDCRCFTVVSRSP